MVGVPRVRRARHAALALACGLALAAAPSTRAGQVRVDVGTASDAFVFSPRAVNLNLGDHVVWVWRNGSHTVTSGDSSGASWDGVFDSGLQGSARRFSWKSDRTGHVLYFCVPHFPDMAGRAIVTDPNVSPQVPVADFRLTEVQFNAPGALDLIEITNYGDAAGNLGRYRLAIAGTGTGEEIPVDDFTVPAGGRVVVHPAAGGVNNPTNIYLPSLPALADAAGSLALYVPNIQANGFPASSALNQPSMIIDFVQWGAGGQPNEATAVGAGFWGSGTSINGVAVGHSIEYCADAGLNHGVGRWAEIAVPNFGANGDCTTPVTNPTWGRLKTLYRD